MLQALLAVEKYSFWLPEPASNNAGVYDNLFYFILAINIVFSSLIMALMIFFVLRFRHRKNQKDVKHDPTAGHSTALELTWTIIPTLLVLVIFYFGFRGYLKANTIPAMDPWPDSGKSGELEWNARAVTASGSMWKWSFSYTSGLVDDELHLIVNEPSAMTLESADVIHDLDIPAFRMKKDVVPGRYNKEWFEPNKEGEYQVYCAMYCGTGHSIMLAKCVVESKESFNKWMRNKLEWAPRESYVERGKELYPKFGCNTCHSLDGAKGTGPTWKDLYGSQVPLTTGNSVLADDDYITESILEPSKKIVLGFEDKMPRDFGDRLKPADITALIWFMKSISPNYKGSMSEGLRVGAAMKSAGPTTAPTTTPTEPVVPPAAPGGTSKTGV